MKSRAAALDCLASRHSLLLATFSCGRWDAGTWAQAARVPVFGKVGGRPLVVEQSCPDQWVVRRGGGLRRGGGKLCDRMGCDE